MAIETALYLQHQTDPELVQIPARLHRLLPFSLLTEGVLDVAAGELAVRERAAGATFDIEIDPGRFLVVGDGQADQGAYLGRSTAVETRAVPPAPGAGERTDLVIVRQYDHLVDGSDRYDADFEIIEGDGGQPAPYGDVPDTAFVLAEIGPIDNETASITDDLITIVAPQAAIPEPLSGIGGSVLTTLGDLLTHDGTDEVRLPAGTEGQVPTYQANGSVAPADVPGGDALASQTDDLSDVTKHTAETEIGTTFATLFDLSGAGYLVSAYGSSSHSTRLIEIRITVDGATPVVITGATNTNNASHVVIPPIRFEATCLLEYRVTLSETGVAVMAWTKLG